MGVYRAKDEDGCQGGLDRGVSCWWTVSTRNALLSKLLTISRVTIVGILRVIELYKMYYKPGYNSQESLSGTLSSIEVNLAIIACCGPALRPLFRKMFPRLFSGRTTNEAGIYKSQSKYGNGTGGVGSFHLKDMSRTRTQTEIRGYTPNGSEEEIMTYNGILRTTAVSCCLLVLGFVLNY